MQYIRWLHGTQPSKAPCAGAGRKSFKGSTNSPVISNRSRAAAANMAPASRFVGSPTVSECFPWDQRSYL